MTNEEEDFYNEFLMETKEHIELIEKNLLILEKDFNNKEIIKEIFRSYHTIKGSAAYMGHTNIKNIAHKIETLLDKIRKDKLNINSNIINFLFNSIDLMKNLLAKKNKKFDISEIENSINELIKNNNQNNITKSNNFRFIKIDSQLDDDTLTENNDDIEIRNKYLIFKIANVNFGLNLIFVDEITKLRKGTFLPFTEKYITKLINVRGEIIPQVDLRLRFNLKYKESPENIIIIIKYDDSHIGLKVDMVKMIIEIPAQQIKTFTKKFKDFNSEYIKGFYMYNNKPIIILDIKKVLERSRHFNL